MNDLSGGATQSRTGLDEFAIRCIVVSRPPNLKKINKLAVLVCMFLALFNAQLDRNWTGYNIKDSQDLGQAYSIKTGTNVTPPQDPSPSPSLPEQLECLSLRHHFSGRVYVG